MQRDSREATGAGARSAWAADCPLVWSPVGTVAFGIFSLTLTSVCMLWDEFGQPLTPLSATLVALSLFAILIATTRRSLCAADPVLWIPVLCLLFYFGMPIPVEFLGTFPDYDAWKLGRQAPRLAQGFAVALLGLSSLAFGFHLAGLRAVGSPPMDDPGHGRDLLVPGLVTLLLGLAMTAVGVLIVGPQLITGNYDEYQLARKWGDEDFRLLNVGVSVAPCGALAIIASHRAGRSAATWVGLLGLAPTVLLNTLMGNRGNVMVIGLSAAWVISQRVRRLPFTLVVGVFIAAFLLGPIVGEFRQLRTVSGLSDNSISSLLGRGLYEMGSTVQVFGYSLEEIPKNKPYDLGLSFLNQTYDLIPNVGFSLGTSGFLDSLVHYPSKWLTLVANPVKFEGNLGGYAYALPAEWFFNFGIPGVFLGMTFTGWLTARIRNSARAGTLKLVWSALYFGMMGLLVRNGLGGPLKAAVWPFAILALCTLGSELIFGRGRPRSPVAHGASARPSRLEPTRLDLGSGTQGS